MIVLIMFIVIAIGFAWAMPKKEIDELDNRLKNKKLKQSGGGIWCLNREIWNQNANHAWRTTGSNPVLTTKTEI